MLFIRIVAMPPQFLILGASVKGRKVDNLFNITSDLMILDRAYVVESKLW